MKHLKKSGICINIDCSQVCDLHIWLKETPNKVWMNNFQYESNASVGMWVKIAFAKEVLEPLRFQFQK